MTKFKVKTTEGVEVEIDFFEAMRVSFEYDMINREEDIRSLYEGSDEDIGRTIDLAAHNLSKNESYFDAYWDTIHDAARTIGLTPIEK